MGRLMITGASGGAPTATYALTKRVQTITYPGTLLNGVFEGGSISVADGSNGVTIATSCGAGTVRGRAMSVYADATLKDDHSGSIDNPNMVIPIAFSFDGNAVTITINLGGYQVAGYRFSAIMF